MRDDFLHKLITSLIKENSVICIEDLAVSNMVKNHKLALSLADSAALASLRASASWSKFVEMLEYKALWHDRLVQKVSTFYPSSQTFIKSGFINPQVKDLKLREWSCPTCSNYNLRDNNAALNILGEGLRLIAKSPVRGFQELRGLFKTAAVGIPEALNACGELVSPEVI
ncbi:transposase [Nostoc mirabile]|uniref:transposase n=1 Tax=Nostoc mirabile TaxID=2907820 RepID=UPI001E42938D|nr:transposase [Nostoc mirabile]